MSTMTTTSIAQLQSQEVTVTTTKTSSKNVNSLESKQQETPSPVDSPILKSSSSQDSMISKLLDNADDLTDKISLSFESKYNRKPTDDEINNSIQASIIQYLKVLQSEANDDSNDSDYSPDNQEDKDMEVSDLKDLKEYQAQKILEKEEEEKSEELATANGVIKSKSEEDEVNDDEQREIVESPEFQKEFSEAIESVKQLALADREKVFDRVRESLEEETGEKVTDEELLKGFTELRNELLDSEDDEAYEVDPTFEISEEELQQEIAEAWAIVRELGQIEGAKLADKVRESFYELNGEEPDDDEIQAVFDRVKDELAEEAEEDALEALKDEQLKNLIEATSGEELAFDESSPVTDTVTANALNNATAQKVASKFLSYARSTVSKDLQRQAYQQLSKLIPDRIPTIDEINQTILSLCESRFLISSRSYSKSTEDSSDEDYDPMSDDEGQLLADRDEIDDEDLEEQFDEEDEDNISDEAEQDEDDEDDVDDDLPLKSAPVLTTSIQEKKSSARVDFYFEKTVSGVNPILKAKAVARFEKTHNRKPNNYELGAILRFLSTEQSS